MDETRKTTLGQLEARERYHLLANLLEAFATTPEELNSRSIREVSEGACFVSYSRTVLGEAVKALVVSGLLLKLPNTAGRSTRYVTRRVGMAMIPIYRALVGENSEPF